MHTMKNPLIFEGLSPIQIILIVGGVILLIILLIVLYFTAFRRYLSRKNAKDLISTFEKHHAMLEGEIQQFYARLERISQLNLIYATKANDWKRKLIDFRQGIDAQAYSQANLLQEEIERGTRKELARDLPNAKKIITEHATQVDQLYDELKKILQGEEQGREALINARASLREAKQAFYSQKDSLDMLIEPFEKVFHRLEDLLEEVENTIDSANYQEANNMLQKQINPVIKEITKTIPSLSELCLEVNHLLPERFISLRASFENLAATGYPLQHLASNHDLQVLDDRIEHCREELKKLSIRGVEEECRLIEEKMKNLQASLQKEVEARHIFETTIDDAYLQETELSSDFINLCHALPKVRGIYLLDEEDQAKNDLIQNVVNQCGASRRVLDTYIHNTIKQPYTLLLSKEEQLQNQVKEGKEEISSFRAYLSSLKVDAEKNQHLLPQVAKKVAEIEVMLKEINNSSLINQKEKDILHLHELLDSLNETLSSLPIDIKKANALGQELNEKASALYEEVLSLKENEEKAATAILEANSYRNDRTENENRCLQAEALYQNGEYANAYALALEVIKQSALQEGRETE